MAEGNKNNLMTGKLEEIILLGRNENILDSNKEGCICSINCKHGKYHLHGHACEQYENRYKEKIKELKSPDELVDSLKKLLDFSYPVERRNSTLQIIENGFKTADYRFSEGWIFVIEEGDVIKTMYHKGSIKKNKNYRRIDK